MDKTELKELSREGRFASWTLFKWAAVVLPVVLIVGLGVFWLLTATSIVTRDIQREVTQHSQQYVEAKVNLLNKLYSDWTQLQAEIKVMEVAGGGEEIISAKQAQQRAIAIRAKTEAGMIPESQVPTDVKRLVAEQY